MSVQAVIDLIASDSRFKPAINDAKKALEGLQARMNSTANAAKVVLAVGGGAVAVFLKNASEQESAESALRAALKANGQSAEVWFDKLNAVASELQNVTTSGDDANLSIMTMLVNTGLAASKLEDATKAAIGLSTILKTDARSSAINYAKALNGNFNMLQKLIPSIAQAKTDQEKLNMVNRLAAAGFAQAQAETRTLGGSLVQLKNILGDAAEEFGFALLPVIKDMVDRVKQVAPLVGRWAKENNALILSIVKWSAILLGTAIILPKIIGGITGTITAVKGLAGAYRILMGLGVGKLLSSLIMSPLASSIAAAAVAVGYLVSRFMEMRRQVNEVNAAVGQTSEAWKEMQKARDAASKADSLEEQIAAMEELRAVTLKQAEAEAASRAVFKNNFVFNSGQSEALETNSRKNEARLRKQAEEQQHQIDRIGEAIIERNRLMADGGPTEEQLALAASIEEVKNKLQEEADTVGKTAREVEIYRLQLQGATEEQLNEVRALNNAVSASEQAVKTREEHAKAEEKVAAALKRVRDELDVLTGTTTQDKLELFDLENLGVAERSVREIARLMDAKRVVEHRKALEQEAASLKDSMMSEEERVDKQMTRLGEMFNAGFLDKDQLAKAVEQAVSGLNIKVGETLLGKFEGLQDTFKRIQSAAAQPKKQPDMLKRIGDKVSEQVVFARQMLGLLPMKDAIDRIRDLIVANTPMVARFAR